jgi:transcriptional regulator
MYNPKHFATEDLAQMHALMGRYNFATLVTQHDGAPFASHLPFLVDPARGPYGTLLAHVARGNPQWRDLADGQTALAIFQGPHAYITPSWYSVELSVPTWNYATVHAYGAARIVDDREELYAMLKRLVATHEAGFEQPWPMDLPDDYMDKMMRGVVGFEIEIARLEGKLKLSQNRSAEDRARVEAELSASPDPTTAGVAALMAELPQP